ncbi:MAG TPA: hypothetical protein VJT09_08190 [Pyrinomonadaceae bacterium]|nr:hypothetical protein [Pyrinomonadaceae bacterium]
MRERIRFEREMEDLEATMDFQAEDPDQTPKQVVIYVRGATYVDMGGHTRSIPANAPWRYAHPRGARSNTVLSLFDYELGLHKRWDNWDGSLPPNTVPSAQLRITSVLDLYTYIKGLPSATLQELHIFTHGWTGGPIITGTTQTDPFKVDQTRRDPADTDARIKDFSIPGVAGGAAGAQFMQAFSSSALVKLWGCYYEQAYRDKIVNFFKARTSSQKDAIKKGYQSDIENKTYQFALHRASGVPVYAAPMGWGTNPDLPFGIHGTAADKYVAEKKMRYVGRWPPRTGDNWWQVSQHFRYDGGFKFYKDVLKANLDILDYAAYTDALIK